MQNVLVLRRHGQICQWIFQHFCGFLEAAVNVQRASLSLLPTVNSGDHVCGGGRNQVKIYVRFAGRAAERSHPGQSAGAIAAQDCYYRAKGSAISILQCHL